jgi:hypothetical protein
MACVASLLEVGLDECPDLYEHEKRGREWWPVLNEFLRGHRMSAFFTVGTAPAGYAIGNGLGPRGLAHSCVVLDGEIVHDPVPEGGGLCCIDSYIELVPEEVSS